MAIAAVAVGCGVAPGPGDPGPSTTDPFSGLDLDSVASHDESGRNGAFATAERIAVTADQPLAVSGRISDASDVDVYDLGPVRKGDRVVAEVFGTSTLTGSIGLFDDNADSILINDSNNVYLGRLEPYVDVVMRRDMAHCYVAVAATVGSDSFGDYELAVFTSSDEALPATRPQVALLNFAGAEQVRLGSRAPVTVPPFDAATLSSRYAGQTEAMEAFIVAAVRQDYLGMNVVILSTSEGAVDDGTMTRINFGTYDASLLGVAEGVDEFNERAVQEAIVFTDTFTVFDRLSPSVSEMAQALANVASHELGHLLGLVHTADVRDVMDVTAGLTELMQDQQFATAELEHQVFPLGRQNSAQYLYDVVGGDLDLINQVAAIHKSAVVRAKSLDVLESRMRRRELVFGSCGLPSR